MKHKYLKNIVTLELDSTKCRGCGKCTEVCPHQVFNISNNKAEIIDRDSCMECGACAKNCVFNAIKVKTGVGCATAIIYGAILGTEPTCDGSSDSGCC